MNVNVKILFFILIEFVREKIICIDVNVEFRHWHIELCQSILNNSINNQTEIAHGNKDVCWHEIFPSTESPKIFKWTHWKPSASFRSASCPRSPTSEKSGDKPTLSASTSTPPSSGKKASTNWPTIVAKATKSKNCNHPEIDVYFISNFQNLLLFFW